MASDSVVLTSYGHLEASDPLKWPNGDFICEILKSENRESEHDSDPEYWQTSLRRAVLQKYGFDDNETDSNDIRKSWETALTRHEDANDDSNRSNDLQQFVKSRCRQSNGNTLQWHVMNCAPSIQFRLHAHPNIEVVYCLTGQLHEVRMLGEPFVLEPCQKQGPNLTSTRRPWKFATLSEKEWLVNEVGSIHKSFTGPAGCQLLVLWGGSHADVTQPPMSPDVEDAVEKIQNDLAEITCGCRSGEKMTDTFLPETEKSMP